MRLLDVKAVLDRENHVQGVDPEIEVLKDHDDTTAIYAILSHRWGTEVNYDEMTGLMKMDEQDRSKVRQRYGYQKIIKSCELAMRDGYTWLWIDTCCIDKRSSAELSEAINSMYRWYRNSQMCYVYLNDVDELAFPTEQDFNRFSRSNGWPEWFSRGWTLQELVAPKEAEFFNKSWVSIGIKQDLTSLLEDITRIPEKVLRDEQVLRSTDSSERPRIAHIMSWAADRKTTRVEDRAYSLLGLFGVNMPMLYGEGSKAFQRLQLEIIRMSSDHSIFAWNPKGQLGEHGGVLAGSPGCFWDCHDIENVVSNEFYHELAAHTGLDLSKHLELYTSVNKNSLQLSIFNVTNVGIQLTLPVSVIPDRHNPERCFKAVLPCRDRYGRLVTIDLTSRGLSSYRCLGPVTWIPNKVPEFRSLHLAYAHDAVESHSNLSIDDRRASWYGFTRCGTLPCGITGNTVTFSSQGNALIILVYANNDAGSRFAVGLGYYLGQVWSRIVCDEYPAKQDALLSWLDFAKQIHDDLWNTPIHESHFHNTSDTVRDTHLPGTIWDARVFCRRNDRSYLNVMIGIEQCPGCCIGPREHTYMLESYELWLPWISKSYGSHQLRLDGEPAKFDLCRDQEIALGDYGDSSNGNFERCGNMFDDMQRLGIDPTHSPYRPVVSRVSSYKRGLRRVQTQDDIVVTSSSGESMVLHQPKGLSLPNNEEIELLLKALSTRLAGKHLVTTIVQCSRFYEIDHEEKQRNLGGAESVLTGRNRSTDPGIFTPLCVIARPLAWHREPACSSRRERFKHIREHFYVLANLHHTVGAGALDDSADKQKTSGVVDFSAIFGLQYLDNFVGEITFFERLPSIMETQFRCEASVDAADRDGISARPCPSNPSFNPHCAPLLLKKCKGLDQPWSIGERRNTQNDVRSISQTLSVGLLDRICSSFLGESKDKQRIGRVGCTDYDTVNVHSMVQEITSLQAKLEATHDEDEQRALEEDITGKILLLYWCGISSEVDQLLPKVVEYIRMERDSDARPSGLREIAEIIKGTPYISPDDDIAHLRRVMLDAGADISKYKLWLAAQAAERARCPGVLVSGDNPFPGTQEITPGASPEVPTGTASKHASLQTRIVTLLMGIKQSARNLSRSGQRQVSPR